MSRQPPREFVAPVQRFRLRYAKRGRLRFASHRDFQRAFERALRRAEVPMAYSAGFSPHPKISYANAAPTGTASEAEYLEIGVSERCEADDLQRRIDQALPPGLDIVEVVEARTSDFIQRLEASRWRIELPGVEPEVAAQAAQALLAAPEVVVERLTKNGMRRVEVLPAIVDLHVRAPEGSAASAAGATGPCAILDVVLRQGTPAVRPDDVLAALRSVADLAPQVPPQVTRESQGPLAEGGNAGGTTIGDPLAADREA
ncbi:MAG: radical SAM protein [Actinomycetales bacterium mxb001]|nr:MAG: radical SAM protein [Actinomycetales bacterium mxb001]